MERNVSGPDGRSWTVRCYRYRRPPWRPVGSGIGVLDPDEGFGLMYLPLVLVYLVLAPLTLLVFPLLVFLAESVCRGVWALVSSMRWVEALHEGKARSKMSWATDADHVDAVVDQIARQLELGYDRVSAHRARFLGFG